MHWLSVHCCALAQVQVGESRHTSTQDGSGAMATASRVLPEVFDSAPESWPWPPGAWRPSCFQFIPFIPFRGLVHEPEIEDLHRSRTATKSLWSRRNSGQPKRANAMVWQSSLVQTGPCHYDRGQCPAPKAARLPGPCASFPVAVLVAPWQCRAAMLEHPASHVLGATL